MVDRENAEPEATMDVAPNTVLEGLVNENHRLKTWIAGMVVGCEGCTAEATKWAEAMGVTHEG